MINLVKQKFERLTVVRQSGKNNNNHILWLCLCDCGQKVIVQSSNLITGHTRSCGCLRKELSTKHGHNTRVGRSKTHISWSNMVQRCTDSNQKLYRNYEGRGISICKRWMKFENFLEDMGEPPDQTYSIDRIDNDGNYCKSNCRWATREQQQRNKRNNHLLTHNRKTQCISAWAKEIGINQTTLRARLKYGWSIKKALTKLVNSRKEKKDE